MLFANGRWREENQGKGPLCTAAASHLHRSALRKGGAAQQAWPGLWKGAYEHLDRPQRSWFCRLVVFCCLSHILLLRGGFVPDQC